MKATSPSACQVNFDLTLVPETTDIWLQAVFQLDIPEAGLTFDMLLPFDGETASMIFLGYFDLDMELEVTGTNVTPVPGATYTNKVTHRHMVGVYSPILSFSVRQQPGDGTGGDGDGDLVLWLVAALLIIGAVAIYLYSGRRPTPGDGDKEGTEVDGAEDDGSDIHGLELEKEALVERIRQLDQRLEEGEIDEDEHAAKRAELKAKAVEVMRRIDELRDE